MKEMPPSLASAMAIVSFETDCIIAEVIGMLIRSLQSSPRLNLTSGVDRSTFAGMQSVDE